MNTVSRKRVLSLCAAITLLAPGMALAQTVKEKELEARIAQLEKIVAQLAAQQQQTEQQMVQAQQAAAEAKASTERVQVAQKAAANPIQSGPIQSGSIMPAANRGTAFTYGGFIKMDAMLTDTDDGKIADGSAGRMFYLPSTIPVGGVAAVDPYADFGAQFSRFWFSADHVTDGGDKIKAYIEVDFFGGGSGNIGNETSTNTHAVTLRQAYVSWNEWLAGQTWSNFMDVAALPDAVDFVGVTDGTVFVRQAQIRYTNGPWSFSLENPQTWYQNGSPAHIQSGQNNVPDATARWQTKGDWGHFSVAGIARQLRTQTDSTTGTALSVAGSFKLGASDTLQYTLSGGPGLGRYIGFGMAPDAYVDVDGALEAQDLVAGFAAWRHDWNDRLRSTLAYSAAHIDTDLAAIGPLATKINSGSQNRKGTRLRRILGQTQRIAAPKTAPLITKTAVK